MKKSILIMAALMITSMMLTGCGDSATAEKKLEVNVGDIVTLGSYEQDADTSNGTEPIEWRVLAKEDGKALLMTAKGIDKKLYNEEDADVTWETCTLRQWLNNEFINEAFKEDERGMIATTNVVNADNPVFGTAGGNDTEDKIFLLSIDEIEQYFADDDDRMIVPTPYAVENDVFQSHDFFKDGNGTCYWWLRSIGEYTNYAASVDTDGDSINDGFEVDDDYGAICPAMWVNL